MKTQLYLTFYDAKRHLILRWRIAELSPEPELKCQLRVTDDSDKWAARPFMLAYEGIVTSGVIKSAYDFSLRETITRFLQI